MTKIALAAALLMSTATVALAMDGSYPNRTKRSLSNASAAQSTQVNQGRNASVPMTNNIMMNVMDRASSPFACGG